MVMQERWLRGSHAERPRAEHGSLAYSNKGRQQAQYHKGDLVEHVGLDTGLNEHLPGVLAKKGIALGFKAEASG